MKKRILTIILAFLPISVFAQSDLFAEPENTEKTEEIKKVEETIEIFPPNSNTQSQNTQIEGCTDNTAINYDPQATIHTESACIYAPTPHTPQDITGYITNTEVQQGATTWNVTLNVSVENATLNYNKIQTWNRFTPINAVTEGKKITITFQQFDGQRLKAECNSYELTIPRKSLTTPEGDENANPITGNFRIAGCPENPQNADEQNTENTENDDKKPASTIKENGLYISLFDTDENGKQYINIVNTIYLLGLVSFFAVFFFVLFGFIKNSFLGKKSSR